MIDKELVIKEIEKQKIQYWDFRYSKIKGSEIILWNKELKQINENDSEGYGLRIFNNGVWGFSGGTKIDKESIRKSVKSAILMSKSFKKDKIFQKIENPSNFKEEKKILGIKDFTKISLEDKKKFITDLNYEIKDEIKSVFLKYLDSREERLFFNSQSEIKQTTDALYLIGKISASDSGKEEEKLFRIANLGGFENLENSQKELDDAILRTKKFLKAKNMKPGIFDSVLSGEITGLFVHEALGHASEADLVLKGASCLKGMIGKKLAEQSVSILDDPTQDNFRGWGSYYYDDEGIKSQKNYILKKGFLNSYLHSIETAKSFNTFSTGNARAENALSMPIVRMSNTYVEKGEYSFEELINEIKEGYFLNGFKGGETDPALGQFQFGISDAYYVKNGKITEPIRCGSIAGNTLDFLNKIKFIENKYSEDSPGFCGKSGQRVFAGGRNPAVFVKGANLT